MKKILTSSMRLGGAIYIIAGIAFILVTLDLALLVGAFGFAFIDALFGDTSGAAFWINFLHHIPNATKLIP